MRRKKERKRCEREEREEERGKREKETKGKEEREGKGVARISQYMLFYFDAGILTCNQDSRTTPLQKNEFQENSWLNTKDLQNNVQTTRIQAV